MKISWKRMQKKTGLTNKVYQVKVFQKRKKKRPKTGWVSGLKYALSKIKQKSLIGENHQVVNHIS